MQMGKTGRRKRSNKGVRYEVYADPDLYGTGRPIATRLLKAAIVLAMAGILIALRHPLGAAFADVLPWRHL